MFSAFQNKGFASLGQAFESLGQLVAPIPDNVGNVDEIRENDENEYDDAEDGFENAILKHIHQQREAVIESAPSYDEVSSPVSESSLTTITLEDESPKQSFRREEQPPAVFSTAFLSNTELEKSVQQKYRESLEKGLAQKERQLKETIRNFELRIAEVEEERDMYRVHATNNTKAVNCQSTISQVIHEEIAELQNILQSRNNDMSSLQLQLDKSIAREQSLEVEKQCLHQQNVQLVEQLNNLQQQLTASPSVIDNSSVEILRLRTEIMQLTQQNRNFIADLSEYELQVRELRQQCDQHEAYMHENQSQMHIQQELLLESERCNDAIRAELQKWKELYERNSENFALLQQELQNEPERNAQEQQKLFNTIQSLQNEVTKLNLALIESESTLKETEESAWKHKAEAGELLWAMQTAEEKVKRLQAERETEKQVHKTTIDVLQEELQTSKLQLQQLQQQQPTSPAVATTIESTSEADTNNHIAQQQQYNDEMYKELEHINHSLQQELQSVRNELSRSTQQLEQSQVLLTEESRRVAAKQQEFDTLQQTWHQSESKLLAFQNSLQSLYMELLQGPGSATQSNAIPHQSDFFIELTDKVRQLKQLEMDHEKLRLELVQVRKAQHQVVQSSQEQSSEIRTRLLNAEDENRKLHQVITQLRSVRKAQNSEEQSAVQELSSLKTNYQLLLQENTDLKRIAVLYHELSSQLPSLQDSLAQLRADNHQLDAALQETKRYLAIKEKELYDQNTILTVAQSEQRLLKQEIALRNTEINNLKDALQYVDSDHRSQLQVLRQQITEMQKEKEEYAQRYSKAQEQQIMEAMKVLEQKCHVLQQQQEDHEIVLRQRDLQYEQEKRRMQQTLQEAVQQLQNSSQDVVDRALIANLVACYFQRKRSREVLQLISKVLAFNEEQLIAVGLKVPPINIFNSLLSSVMGSSPATAEIAPVQGDNLAEMWINFLITQAEDDQQKRGGGSRSNSSQPSTPRNVSSNGSSSVGASPPTAALSSSINSSKNGLG